jgi:hypothetical protein
MGKTKNLSVSYAESARSKLMFISSLLESWISDDPGHYKKLPEWPEWAGKQVPEKILNALFIQDKRLRQLLRNPPLKGCESWEDFFNKRNKVIEDFLKTGKLNNFTIFPLAAIINDDGVYTVLKRDCDDLIRILPYCPSTKKGNLKFTFLQDVIEQVNRIAISLINRREGREEHKEIFVASGKKGTDKRWEESRKAHDAEQNKANEIWKDPRRAKWSKSRVAVMIAKEMGGNKDTIRRRIKKEKPSG